jgi:dephospho-CoA kinase
MVQLPKSYKKKKSHFIIKNDFTKLSVNKGIKKILSEIK